MIFSEILSKTFLGVLPYSPYQIGVSGKITEPKGLEFDPMLGMMIPFIGLGALALAFFIKKRIDK